jgi:hypothetical protein
MEPSEILAKWNQLRADLRSRNTNDEIPSVETGTIVSSGTVRLAISDGALCSLLLPVPIQDSFEVNRISQLISLRTLTLIQKGKNLRFLEVRCDDERLTEVFARVVSDILRRIESGVTGPRSVDEALIEFRKLLNRQHIRAVEEMTVVGLIGELITLIEVLGINSRSVVAWHGPDSDRHDFRAGSVAIEVKTSLGAEGNRIHVNGIRQLETAEDDELLIRHVRIEPDPHGTLSVPDLVAEAGALIADRCLFDEKLDKLGYSADCAASWGDKRYRIVGKDAYSVRGSFPRLTTRHLNIEWPLAGVSGVAYEVDLGAAAQFLVNDEDWKKQLMEFCSCL